MTIRLWLQDDDTGEVIKQLGTCLTDSPSRAAQMYDREVDTCQEAGVNAQVHWQDITD